MKPVILCLSRSYLSTLLPTLNHHDKEAEYIHIVQNNEEERLVKSLGGVVVMNLQQCVAAAFEDKTFGHYEEPGDFRAVTNYSWNPLFADRYLSEFSISEKYTIAKAVDDQVRGLFLNYNIAAFLSEPVSHFLTHDILYYCKINGATPLLWCNGFLPNTFYFAEETNFTIQSIMDFDYSIENIEELESRIEHHVAQISEDKVGPVYHHAFDEVQRNSIFDYLRQRQGASALIAEPSAFRISLQVFRLFRSVIGRVLFPKFADFMLAGAVEEHKFYLKCLFFRKENYDPIPDSFDVKNIFFPLQYEPEASLIYLAPEYQDQYALVRDILRILPSNKELWVKEHPNQFGALSLTRWINLKSQFPNLKFVFGRDNGRSLIKQCSLSIVISSTAGLDSLILGRRTLVLGATQYAHAPGAKKVNTLSEIAELLSDPQTYTLLSDKAALSAVLLGFAKNCFVGDPQPSSYLYDTENLRNLVKAIHIAGRFDSFSKEDGNLDSVNESLSK